MRHSKGFTLIEVLIAGVILFTAIGLVYGSFSQSVLNTEKAQKVIELNGVLPVIASKIKTEINNSLEQKLTKGDGVIANHRYSWDSHEIKQAPILERANSDGRSGVNIILLEVNVVIYSQNSTKRFSFKETLWR